MEESGSGSGSGSDSYSALLDRKEYLTQRLKELHPKQYNHPCNTTPHKNKDTNKNDSTDTSTALSKEVLHTNGNTCSSSTSIVHKHPGTMVEQHWDFLLKEMMWLSADFLSERSRQISTAKKLSLSVRQYHTNKETRVARQALEVQRKRQKLAMKIARDVKSWWKKLERIVSYKQRVEVDLKRQQTMDKHLVFLVRQTEKYGDAQQQRCVSSVSDYEEDNDRGMMSIEQVLAMGEEEENSSSRTRCKRKLKSLVVVQQHNHASEESSASAAATVTEDDLSSTTSRCLDEADEDEEFEFYNEVDDETTLIAEEMAAKRDSEFRSHEEEMRLLQEDNEVPLEQLREMYRRMEESQVDNVVEGEKVKSVDFCETTKNETQDNQDNESIDQMSLANELDNDDDNDDGSEEFHTNPLDLIDDETTLIEEERLGREQSYADEIAQLTAEQEMPIEQLRAMYMNMNDDMSTSKNDDIEDSIDEAGSLSSEPCSHTSSDDEFTAKEEVDDETTLIAEERLGREMSYDDEINLLKRENEMSVDELRKLYGIVDGVETGGSVASSLDDEHDASVAKYHGEESRDHARETKSHVSLSGDTKVIESSSDDLLQSLQRSDTIARKTLASRPFILSPWVKLRQYQQIGLNWLVSLQSRRLNGILADEMGLGKTLQTISLLSYLACYKGIWGPHLIIVPTSCMVNWEMELKRFCPALKVLCYYGSAKRRKELRTGWTKTNVYHVVITSYQLVVQDSFAYKRKKWYYMILDEAQNIKNFQSQRWQTLINFNTQRRLLLTGTPLQNNLMELWSLLHFLMPHIFRSRKEFSYWFSNPMNNIIDGTSGKNNDLINRLHGIIRPFVLRRLKRDVEKQMPGKFEHIVKCHLSRRQMFLYEEFMARSSTRRVLSGSSGGNFMSLMNVLMQLRKVCNHPDLFEPRSILTPFSMDQLRLRTASCVPDCIQRYPMECVSESLINPFWSPGVGQVDFNNALIFHSTVAQTIRNLRPPSLVSKTDVNKVKSESIYNEPGLMHLLKTLEEYEENESRNRVNFLTKVNTRRCDINAMSILSEKLQGLLTFRKTPFDDNYDDYDYAIISQTPLDLLRMRKSQQQISDELQDIIDRFVFCVPNASAPSPVLSSSKFLGTTRKGNLSSHALLNAIKTYTKPFHRVQSRLTSFFPDKKLIQFDAGKLQTLAILLRNLKEGEHRVLIFTQMSKMLDILEAFLNIHGYTYLRLDGSTGVDQRQRMMDRFNSDPKIFCFILSTRSGGLGINLIGADTVVFYDTDWNPSMDAQAMDRCHRIGQTREVHIYRLVTAHSIEENILIKAKQKRHLDFLVMNEGKFDASASSPTLSPSDEQNTSNNDVFTHDGLREILDVGDNFSVPKDIQEPSVSNIDVENMMTSLEDEDDVQAMRGAKKEAVDDLAEFDENIQYKNDDDSSQADESVISTGNDSLSTTVPKKKKHKTKSDASTSNSSAKKEETDEDKEMQKEFAAWQTKVGIDVNAISTQLCPTERYGLNFRETIDPFYSTYYLTELDRIRLAEEAEKEIDIDEIEAAKIEDERQAMEDGDLLSTSPPPSMLLRQRHLYRRERIRLKADKKRRKLTGEDWVLRKEGTHTLPFSFWYNSDTGAVSLDTPRIIADLDAETVARNKKWNGLPSRCLVKVMSYLVPFPDRMSCSYVCKYWSHTARDLSFVRHVIPVEMGALLEGTKVDYNHYRSINDALMNALPGDTIELADGHYWVNDGLLVDKPLRFIGDEHNCTNVVIELTGKIEWIGCCGWMEGITIRRPHIVSAKSSEKDLTAKGIVLDIHPGIKFDLTHCMINNSGGANSAVKLRGQNKIRWNDVKIIEAEGSGIEITGNSSNILLKQCYIGKNKSFGIALREDRRDQKPETKLEMHNCVIDQNSKGNISNDSSAQIQLYLTDTKVGCKLWKDQEVFVV